MYMYLFRFKFVFRLGIQFFCVAEGGRMSVGV